MTTEAASPDALILLRAAIQLKKLPILTKTASPSKPEDAAQDVVEATHLEFNHNGHQSLPLDAPTRFEISEKPISLRSIWFAFQNRDENISTYLSSVQQLTQALTAAGKEGLVNLPFAAKLDLNTWLDQSSEDSEYIRELSKEEQERQTREAIGAAAGVPAVQTAGTKELDPRLRDIYNAERPIGNRNTILHGSKPQDFKWAYDYATARMGKSKDSKQPAVQARAINGPVGTPALASRNKPSGRRVDPIILVSPSASSLLRLSNIKGFLDEGRFVPPEMGQSDANRLQVQRLLPKIDAHRPLRFILVDSPEMFKDQYWMRVAAVFTTGQSWQFKSYKWQHPPDLFSHALGIYVGWRGDEVPSIVQGWGRGVLKTELDKYHGESQNRWRDREEVEKIWGAIEESMLRHGFDKDGENVRAR